MDPSKRLTLVVGIDFSELSLEALRVALELALASADAHVHLVHAVSAVTTAEIPIDPALVEGAARRQMAEVHAHAMERSGAAVTAHVFIGAPAIVIVELAKRTRADLVVVGTHGRHGLSRLAFGSVAEAVVRTAPCSVLTVRSRAPSAEVDIEPPCPSCLETRTASGGKDLWCARHHEHHPRAHTYSELPASFAVGSMNLRPEG